MSDPYADLGGQRGDPYTETGAIHEPCPHCSAQPGHKCTFTAEEFQPGLGTVKVTKTRHHPCLVRMTTKGRANA